MVSRIHDIFNAALDALKADATLIGPTLLDGDKVYGAVPEDTIPPYVWVLSGDEVPWADSFRSHDAKQVDLDVVAISKYRGTKEVDDIISRVMQVLDTRSTWTGVSGYDSHEFMINTKPAFTEIAGEVWIERSLQWRVRVN
jgi:hypothetical protein